MFLVARVGDFHNSLSRGLFNVRDVGRYVSSFRKAMSVGIKAEKTL